MKFLHIIVVSCFLIATAAPTHCEAGWKRNYGHKHVAAQQQDVSFWMPDNRRFYSIFFPHYNYIVRTNLV